MNKNIPIQEKKSIHFEVRLKTEITKDYTITLITVVNVQEWIKLPSLATQREEKEVFRIGFQDSDKASEAYKIIVTMVENMVSFWRSCPEMLNDWLSK